jgi:hypothetical protein
MPDLGFVPLPQERGVPLHVAVRVGFDESVSNYGVASVAGLDNAT